MYHMMVSEHKKIMMLFHLFFTLTALWKMLVEEICFLPAEEPEGLPDTDIVKLLVKVDDVLLSLPKTKDILSTASQY